ncbi:MAG: hypothetical protein HON65_07240 [Rhodospirillales bacterium]|nr:hypothetical protein [Rhodospirillales bacterium]
MSINIFGFFLIFSRIGTALMLMPGFSAVYVTVPIRLALALAVSFVVAPVIMPIMPIVPATVVDIILMVMAEVFVGVFIGTIARIALGALQVAGTLTAMLSSLANAMIQDPIAEQQSSVVSSFLTFIGVTLLFVTDMHHLMVIAVIESYSLFLPAASLSFGDFAMLVARNVADSFALGLQLASPFVVVGMAYYVGLGVLGRLMPALPLFFFMMPIQITIQFLVMSMSLSVIMMVFLKHFQESFLMFLVP